MKPKDQINLQYTTIKDPLPDFVYKGLKKYSANANLYQPQPEELIAKIAQKNKLSADMVFLVAGIDEALRLFMHGYGKQTYVFTPCYTVYRRPPTYGGKLNTIFCIKDGEYVIPTKRIPKASLIILANPNNPSGVTPKDKVIELVRNNTHAIVVVDEAYGEFSNLSVIELVKKYKNMAVLRSFSKSYGMAGNRLGFVTAYPSVIQVIKDKAQWSNVSYLSVGAGMVALENEQYFKKMREGINKRRDELVAFLKKRGYVVLPSNINAVLIKFESVSKANKFNKYLNDNNIIVSPGNGGSNIGLDDSYTRIAIGNDRQMKTVMSVISKYK